jgi:hypothetical protein
MKVCFLLHGSGVIRTLRIYIGQLTGMSKSELDIITQVD